MINITDVPLDLLLHFLSSVPREFTDLTGMHYKKIFSYFYHCIILSSRVISFTTGSSALYDFDGLFVHYVHFTSILAILINYDKLIVQLK